ncbi:unnamed protein product [Effrenium voratum]|nr:unnamed protein product [Effrenium voratum]
MLGTFNFLAPFAANRRGFGFRGSRGFRGVRSESRGPRLARLARRAAEEQPGISWIKLDRSSQTEAAEPTGDRSVLPLFPMSGAYFPHAQPELSIFEPRYRQLYNDILVSGSRRFVVATPNPDADSIAEVGVVFYLDDLTDVSEESGDEVKYASRLSYSTSYEDDGDDDYEEVDLAELPAKARSELFRLQEQFEEEAAVLHGDLMEFVQAMLRSTCHRQRLRIMRDALAMEERRLAARRALQMLMAESDEPDKPRADVLQKDS